MDRRETDAANVIFADMTVDELISRYPTAARVFINRRMACVGCEVARFESVAEVCQAYGQDPAAMMVDIRKAAQGHVAAKGRAS